MTNIIEKIFNRKELIEQPPVLVDVGASGVVHKAWRDFAKYCICIAFDADDREFQISEQDSSTFKKLYKFNCIVSDKEDEKLDFYLTKNPYCSSTLEPDPNLVKNYVYDDNFNVIEKKTINNISISGALEKLNITKVDWLKTDSQGTDLRIFTNIKKEIRDNILVIEFEPGLCPSYKKEDSAYHVLGYMNDQDFWLSSFDVKGVPRGSKQLLDSLFQNSFTKKLARYSIKKAPKWVEIIYINNFNSNTFTLREYLLGCLFSILNKEYLNAIKLADKGYEMFNDDIFRYVREYSIREIKRSFFGKKVIKGVGNRIQSFFSK